MKVREPRIRKYIPYIIVAILLFASFAVGNVIGTVSTLNLCVDTAFKFLEIQPDGDYHINKELINKYLSYYAGKTIR